jgi:hypothetical protein
LKAARSGQAFSFDEEQRTDFFHFQADAASYPDAEYATPIYQRQGAAEDAPLVIAYELAEALPTRVVNTQGGGSRTKATLDEAAKRWMDPDHVSLLTKHGDLTGAVLVGFVHSHVKPKESDLLSGGDYVVLRQYAFSKEKDSPLGANFQMIGAFKLRSGTMSISVATRSFQGENFPPLVNGHPFEIQLQSRDHNAATAMRNSLGIEIYFGSSKGSLLPLAGGRLPKLTPPGFEPIISSPPVITPLPPITTTPLPH